MTIPPVARPAIFLVLDGYDPLNWAPWNGDPFHKYVDRWLERRSRLLMSTAYARVQRFDIELIGAALHELDRRSEWQSVIGCIVDGRLGRLMRERHRAVCQKLAATANPLYKLTRYYLVVIVDNPERQEQVEHAHDLRLDADALLGRKHVANEMPLNQDAQLLFYLEHCARGAVHSSLSGPA